MTSAGESVRASGTPDSSEWTRIQTTLIPVGETLSLLGRLRGNLLWIYDIANWASLVLIAGSTLAVRWIGSFALPSGVLRLVPAMR